MSQAGPAVQEPTLATLKQSFLHAPRTLRLVWRSSRRTTAMLGLLTIASACLPIAVAHAGKEIVDAVVAGAESDCIRWALIELVLVLGHVFSQRGLSLARALLGARLAIDVNVMVLEKAQELELRHFEDPEFYDQLTRARREASSRPVQVVTETFRMVQNALTLAGYMALLLSYSGVAVLGLILASIPATLAEMRYSNAAFRLRNWRSPDMRRLNYLEYVLANDGHVKEVKLFGIGPLLLSRYRNVAEGFFREDRELSLKRATWAYLLSMLATGAFYACYLVMAVSAVRGRLSLGELTLYVVAFRQGQQAFQACLEAVGGMYENNLYMSNLFHFLAIPTPKALPRREPIAVARAKPEEGIRFENIGFRYPDAKEWALQGVDLHIPKGQSLALVGKNGAGKTTLVKLLARLYEPTSGRILLDGRDLVEWDPQELRRRIGVIFQDFNRYQFKLRENVGLGSVEHLQDEPRILDAMDRGGAAELISELPMGIETPLGRWFKDGTELSGGQWQKIALSRAFMREEADILVLDEPTAALDAEAEHAVFERFRSLSRGRTTILISHRFPTVRMADRIVVLEHGQVVENGTHQELLSAGARYAKLFALQAQGYL
ncbi:MAG: ABC transporter ATP-binding protein [Deltaproteobacteria bacterium]|nr:ABC transporter ATP-binding protein [Deltaproteobacteria bacterium]